MSNNITILLTDQINSSLQQITRDSRIQAIPNNVINSIVPSIASSISKDISDIVNKEANLQLNEIPRTLVGINNPVNIVSDNLSAISLQNILNNSLNTNINNVISNLITNKIDEFLRLNLRDGGNNPSFNLIKNSITESLNKNISNIVNLAVGDFTSEIFDTDTPISPVISNIDQFFSSGDAESGIEQYNDAYNSAVVGETLVESQQFDVNNEDNQEKLLCTRVGFIDPTGTYPTEEYENRQDTNKLATSDINGTIVPKKNKERMIGAKLPGNSSWSQPVSPYKGEYPYNKVIESESGHIIEMDDTPGSERLHVYHRTGTFVEIDSNGSVVTRTKGSKYEIIDKNGHIAISGKADISINGACNIYVGNDANIEVDGDTNITCHNDINAQAGGNFNLSAVENFSIRGRNVFIEADHDLNILSDNITKFKAASIHSYADGGDIYFSSDNQYFKIANNAYTEVGGTYHNLVGVNYYLDTSGIVSINNFNSLESKMAESAISSYAGMLKGRKDVNYIELNNPPFLTEADKYVLSAEEPGATQQEIQTTITRSIKAGITPKSSYEESPTPLETETPSTDNSTFISPNNSLKNLEEVPDNFNLSPNFTLGMLSNKAAVTKDRLVAQSNRTYGEILFNLSAVALNICEPVLKLYPNMFVTSGFRLQSSSSITSQHPLGLAVDIQFRGITKTQYYDIAKILSSKLNYDQLLLEYASSTNNPWIHISVDTARKNRGQVMTFNNHGKYGDGLTQLA